VQQGREHLKKEEAITVMLEVLAVLRESVIISGGSLDLQVPEYQKILRAQAS
jgi:hypothetical protein